MAKPAHKLPFRLEALPRSSSLRVGLFGGSFNPPHEGHRHVSTEAKKRLGLDHVVWLVSPQNPLKNGQQTPPSATRAAWCEALLAQDGGHHVSTIESQFGTRYTIDTIRALKRRWPNVTFVWIMGSDNLAGFHRWRGWREIARLVPIAILERPPFPLHALKGQAAQLLHHARRPDHNAHSIGKNKENGNKWVLLPIRRHPASSTELRKTLGGG
jgi:nicotinate-nucleotide adenylyltransferase